MRVLVLLALVGTALAAPKQVSRIVGGEDTTIEQYPYMSNMMSRLWGIWWTQSCGGSLITTTSVLSAAHCYEGDRASQWQVRLGSSFASSGGQVIPVSRLVLHAQFNSVTIRNDVAIVKLASPAVLSPTVRVARIAGPGYILPDDTPVTSVGWGALSSTGTSSEQLQHVEIYTVNHALCAQRYAYLNSLPLFSGWPDVTDDMLCAGILNGGGKDSCRGDNGGPLVHNSDVLVGIISWRFGCGNQRYPGVNAKVSYFSDWIVANA